MLMSSAWSPLVRDESLMLLIDHQTHLFVRWSEAEYRAMRRHAQVMGQLAQIFQLPLILVAVRGGKHSHQGGPVLSQLVSSFPKATLIQTTKLNAWQEPRLRSAIQSTGRRSLIMAGVCADFGVVPVAVQASAQGEYLVRVALEASGTWDPIITQTVIARLSQAQVAPTTWLAVAGELQGDWADQTTGEPLLKLLQENMQNWVAPHAQTRSGRRSDSTIATFGKLFG
jgi:nicotinamidase-related amidase